ncbi:MAG: carbonic anhydrase [Phycisphaerales bacterium]
MTPNLNRTSMFTAALMLCAGTALGGGSHASPTGHGSTPPAPKPASSEPSKTLRMGATPKASDDDAAHKPAAQPASKPVAKSAAAPATAPSAHASAADGPSAEQALAWLKEGNARFVKQNTENPNSNAERISETAAGQHPFASILSCADSRVPVERVFDRGVGDLFVVRVAGNVAGESETGTLEYGTGHLHTPLLVVMGHTACGAVNAAASGAELHGAVAKLVGRIQPSVEQARAQFPELKPEQITPIAIRLNVMQTIENLITQSEGIGNLVRENKLEIVGAIYDLNSGTVHFLGEHPQETALLKQPRESGDAHADAEPSKSGH